MELNHSPGFKVFAALTVISVSTGLGALVLAQTHLSHQKQLPTSQQVAAPQEQIILKTNSEQVVNKVLKILEEDNVGPDNYRFNGVRVQGGRRIQFSRGALPMNEIVQIKRSPRTATIGNLTAANRPNESVIEVLKNFFDVASLQRIKATLNELDNNMYRLDVVKVTPQRVTPRN
jgi:hypothetical protein